MAPTKIILFGTGQFSQMVGKYILQDAALELAGFTVHEAYVNQKSLFGIPVVPFERIEQEMPPMEFSMLISLGPYRLNRLRTHIFGEAKAKGYHLASYVSPNALLWNEVPLGDGCIIFEQVVLQPFTEVGDNVILRSGCNIGHHTKIADHCFVGAGAFIAGCCAIESGSFVGIGAVIRDGITIARNTVVGAGAVILQDTEENAVYRAEGTKKMPITADQLKHI